MIFAEFIGFRMLLFEMKKSHWYHCRPRKHYTSKALAHVMALSTVWLPSNAFAKRIIKSSDEKNLAPTAGSEVRTK